MAYPYMPLKFSPNVTRKSSRRLPLMACSFTQPPHYCHSLSARHFQIGQVQRRFQALRRFQFP